MSLTSWGASIAPALVLLGALLPGAPVQAQDASGFVPGRLLVQFRPKVSPEQAHAVLVAHGAKTLSEIADIGVRVIQLPLNADERAAAHAFAQDPEVAFAELDELRPPADLTPNDPWFLNWEHNLTQISCPVAWSLTIGSSSVIIAVLDTGVDGTHPDLASKMVPGWNIYSNNSDTSDVNGHGTLVAGTVGASSDNGVGVASVAWSCPIMPVRIADSTGTATLSNIASGLNWAADHGARVANISYRASDSSTVASAAMYFMSKGGVVTVAAGNESTFSSSADNPYVLTVSATDSTDALYSWSNTGNNIDLAAPGWSYTTVNGGGYSSAAGTSIAAPMVAGVAALVLSANPALTASQVMTVLEQSANDFGPMGWDTSYGWGRVNAAQAVSLALNTGSAPDTTPPTVSISAPSSNATVTGMVTVQVSASDNVGVASVSLSVDGALQGTLTVAPYNFSLNTATLSNGSHTLTAVATDAAGNSASAQVTVLVSNAVADMTAPTVAITSPVTGATVTGSLAVAVSAADNVGVTKVELYVDGKLTATDTSAPYNFTVNTRRWAAGQHTLTAKAYDAAGNAAASAACLVTK